MLKNLVCEKQGLLRARRGLIAPTRLPATWRCRALSSAARRASRRATARPTCRGRWPTPCSPRPQRGREAAARATPGEPARSVAPTTYDRRA
eukprot:3776393-Alexandrium_andersonii.AAC.1